MNRLILLALILALLGANGYVYAAIFGPTSVRVTQLEVGEGGATLVSLPKGHAILVNTGADASVVRALGEALPPWQRHIDALVLLSSNKNEVGGEPFVSAAYAVGAVQKIPPGAGLLLHYGSLTLPLSSTTRAGVYTVK